MGRCQQGELRKPVAVESHCHKANRVFDHSPTCQEPCLIGDSLRLGYAEFALSPHYRASNARRLTHTWVIPRICLNNSVYNNASYWYSAEGNLDRKTPR